VKTQTSLLTAAGDNLEEVRTPVTQELIESKLLDPQQANIELLSRNEAWQAATATL
jgi:hypothetical protein